MQFLKAIRITQFKNDKSAQDSRLLKRDFLNYKKAYAKSD